jgi:hypothetical protein
MNIAYLDYTCKAGESRGDYSDAFFPDCPSLPRKSNVFALSDGTTQGMLNREWANILVKSFADLAQSRLDIREVLLRTIDSSIEQWESIRQQYVARKNSVLDENEYRWLFEYGSHATFLGLRFGSGYWEAVAIGDTCLFVLGREVTCFPIQEPSSFTDSPKLISSLRNRNANIDQDTICIKKELEKGNTFYLMTDALAHWFLSEYKMDKEPWNQISESLDYAGCLALAKRQTKPERARRILGGLFRRLKGSVSLVARNAPSTSASFRDWVGKLRESAGLVNDDTTLMILKP